MLYIQIISHTSIEYINALYMIPASESDITDIQTQVTWITGNMYIKCTHVCICIYIYIFQQQELVYMELDSFLFCQECMGIQRDITVTDVVNPKNINTSTDLSLKLVVDRADTLRLVREAGTSHFFNRQRIYPPVIWQFAMEALAHLPISQRKFRSLSKNV
jgi:hypothetical protein